MKDYYPLKLRELEGVIKASNILNKSFPEPEPEPEDEEQLIEVDSEPLTEKEEEEAREAWSEWWRQEHAYGELRSAFDQLTPRELALAAQEALRRIREGNDDGN